MSRPVVPRGGRLRPLGLDEVRITGGFWGDRQRLNGSVTLDHCLTRVDRTGWLANFQLAAGGGSPGARRGREFSDSEVYKLIEAIAWESARGHQAAPVVDELVAIIGHAQDPDGYLNTAFGRAGQPARYSDLEWGHELYCHGHLIQAAVAQARVGGGPLLDIATRAADHVCDTFGPGGNDGICGHPCIEMALVELARVTGQERYLDQAARFVSRRGHGRLADIALGRAYYQDDIPVREASILRGHAVRALYLAAGAVDVAVETGDDALLEAVVNQWDATVARRTYLTGGMGARHAGESFGEDYALPPDRAYSETCAAVASVMLSWRLLLATGDPRYADLAERTLFNVVATSPANDGRSFFYVNTLHQRRRGTPWDPDAISPRPSSDLRAPWFDVSCCPMNIARLLASLAAYVATADGDGIQLHQYADMDIRTTLDAGDVGLRVRTGYPDDGAVTVEVTEAPPGPVTLSLRVPAWAIGRAQLTEAGGSPARIAGASVAEVRRAFGVGDVIRLDLPVEPRWTSADPRIDAVRGMVAVERGPVVFCVESVDLPGQVDVDAVRVDPRKRPVDAVGRVLVTGALVDPAGAGWPYRDADTEPPDTRRDAEIPMLPYHSWANRGPTTMRVWLPTTALP